MTAVARNAHTVAATEALDEPGLSIDGRRARFDREVLAHLDGLYAFAAKLTRSRHDAEDLVSDTVVRAFDRWEQYTLGTNARAWLFTILYRVFLTRWRREKREVSIEDDGEFAAHEVVGEADPEATFYDALVDDEITGAIDELPERYRAAVVLSDVQGFRYAEIAEILQIPEGTAKSRLFRGRRILQTKLRRYAIEAGYVRSSSRIAA